MLVFLAPDSKRLDELEDATRQYLAWKQIVGSKDERNLNVAQAKAMRRMTEMRQSEISADDH